jgi:cell division protein FtsW
MKRSRKQAEISSSSSSPGGSAAQALGSLCEWPPRFPQGIDYALLLTVLAMVIFGLIMVYSASFIYAQERTGDGFAFIKKQLSVAALGFAALYAACRMPYRKWADWAYPLLGIAATLLVLVLIPGIGARVGGAQRWIHLGPFNVQPGEIAKFAVVIFVARLLERKHDRLHKLVPGMISPFFLALPVFGLLLAQPDFGTTAMITMVIFFLMFLAGVPKRYLGSALLAGGIVGSWLVLGTEYRRARLHAFMDPWSDPAGKGFQIIQSLTGLHNGQLLGTGLGNGKEKLFYLPEAHNDFIFAVIGEEMGFLGVTLVAGAYLYFTYRGFKIGWDAFERWGDKFGMLLACGITLALGLQGFVNMAVVLGLLPTKGLTLPFISYGGSALLVDLFAVGILLSIARGPRLR